LWVVALLSVLCASCVPVDSSVGDLVGRWRVTWTCGVEVLELRADGTYAHSVEFAAGGRAHHSGAWRLVPKREFLAGAEVVLVDALQSCSVFGERVVPPHREDRPLEAEWEWGKLVLHFNPDIQPFVRQ
jgi:hypothetical protein